MTRIRYRYRDEEPSSGTAITTLTLGALAGFAVGVLVAQKAGGLSGIAAQLRRRFADLEDEDDEPARVAGHAGDEELDEEALEEEAAEVEAAIEEEERAEAEAEAEAALEEEALEEEAHGADVGELEERVLEAFEDDTVLGERAIDISAVADGTIELSGWVDSDTEVAHAVAVTSAVDGVRSVVNRLEVGEPGSASAAGAERDVEVDVAKETPPPPARRRSRRPPRDDAAESDAGA